MLSITQRVRDVQVRQQRQWLWQCVSAGLLAGGAVGTAAAALRIFTQGAFSWIWIVAAVLLPILIAGCLAIVRSTTMQLAARTIDNRCGLKDRTQTALQFLASKADDSAMRRLQVEDAGNHLQSVDPVTVAPILAPKSWGLGILMTVMACVLSFFAGQSERIHAATEINEVLSAQADRAEVGLEELKQFQQEQNDPELEKVLKELARQLTELKTPGLDPKEAMAKLSEMEAVLQRMQQHVAEASVVAELQEVGEALSLAEAMAVAGQAMARGEMEKAAEELSKLEMPELDRKTEKAIGERLEQIQSSKSESGQKQSLKESLKKVSDGLSSGDRNKFQDGMKSLAGECKKQGQKKKLSDLLEKQSQRLRESKSELESEARSQAKAQSNRKGGQKAGKGNTDLNGDKTTKQKTGSEMKLKGEDSGAGDSDVETEKGSEEEQEAVRQYRRNSLRYEALNESVLESESIPLGHRQTIRRYFEMIRPSAAESDAVDAQTEKNQDGN